MKIIVVVLCLAAPSLGTAYDWREAQREQDAIDSRQQQQEMASRLERMERQQKYDSWNREFEERREAQQRDNDYRRQQPVIIYPTQNSY